MKGYMLKVPADIAEGTSKTELNASPGLDVLQKAVGGNIEIVPYLDEFVTPNSRLKCVAFCNEEGKLNSLPSNFIANVIWAACLDTKKLNMFDNLCGDVVILWGDDEFMDSI